MAVSALDLGHVTLPPRSRPGAQLTVLDVTKWFGETSGGVRTYLNEKSAYVRKQPALRHVLALPGSTDQIVDDDGVRTYRLRGPRIPTQKQYRFLLATRSLRRIVEHEKPDVIEVGSQFLVPWVTRLATRGKGTPVVSFYHGNIERNVPVSLGFEADTAHVTRALTRGYMRVVDSLFAARFAASDAMANDLRAAGIRDITRVRLGVDTDTFHPSRRANRERVRREYGIPVDARVAMYCGRIAVEKELPWLVRTWPKVSARTGAWLVLIGEGAPRAQLMAESRADARKIIWLPHETDRARLADLLACIDVYIAPGPIETFGLSALEAMASGAAVVTVDRGAVTELVERTGGGAVYRFRDDGGFEVAVAGVLGGDPMRAGELGREFAVREHSWDSVFAELFAVYARLANR